MDDKPHFPQMMTIFEDSLPGELEILRRLDQARQRRDSRRSVRLPLGLAFATLSIVSIAFFIATRPNPSPRVSAEPAAARPAREERVVSIPAPAPKRPAKSALPPPPPPPPSPPAKAQKAPSLIEPESPAPPSWSQVATALRTGNRTEASTIVQRLTESDDPETRQSAALYQIRENLRHGADALSPADLALLQDLVTTGATASIRLDAKKHLTRATLPPSNNP